MAANVPPSASDQLALVERRRWHLWIVAAVFMLAGSSAVVLALTGRVDITVADHPSVRWGFLALTVAFLFYVFEQERQSRRLLRQALAAREEAIHLEGRVESLTTLVEAARAINSVLAPEEVFAVLLDAATGLAHADHAAVLLRVRDELVVVVSHGPDAVAAGTRLPEAEASGLVADALATGRPASSTLPSGAHVAGLTHGGAGGGSAVVAPLEVAGRTIGVLAVGRITGRPEFSEDDAGAVALFAEHAATAATNARRFNAERENVRGLAEAADKRADFVAMMVHDLRTPLQAASGYARLLKDRHERLAPAQRQQALDGIASQTDRLEKMIAEILRSSRVEAGQELQHTPVDLPALAHDIAKTIEARGPSMNVSVSIGADVGTMMGDEDAMRHVLSNLLDNAAKFSPSGAPIELHILRNGEDVDIHVADRGPGIPPEQIDDLFDRFRQVGTPGEGGIGLGLYIVRTLAQAHGGDVTARNREGGGAIFTVNLPHV